MLALDRLRTLLAASLILSGCGEIGSDPQGPNKAYLTLRSDSGNIRDFYLGGYDSVAECLDMVEFEAASAAEDKNEFWTNADFSYGGRGSKKAGWTRNIVVGGKCQKG